MTFNFAFWAVVGAAALFYLCLFTASATIGQITMAWRSYAMSIAWFVIAMAIVHIYHSRFWATNISSRALLFYGIAAMIALVRAAYHFRKAWQTH